MLRERVRYERLRKVHSMLHDLFSYCSKKITFCLKVHSLQESGLNMFEYVYTSMIEMSN